MSTPEHVLQSVSDFFPLQRHVTAVFFPEPCHGFIYLHLIFPSLHLQCIFLSIVTRTAASCSFLCLNPCGTGCVYPRCRMDTWAIYCVCGDIYVRFPRAVVLGSLRWLNDTRFSIFCTRAFGLLRYCVRYRRSLKILSTVATRSRSSPYIH